VKGRSLCSNIVNTDMYYTKRVTVPRRTTETNPTLTAIKMTVGVITAVEVGFPPGCADLVKVQLWHEGWQIVPWSRGEWLSWDDYIFRVDMNYPIDTEPTTVYIKAYNEDDLFDHTIFVGIHFREGEPDKTLVNFLKDLKRLAYVGV